MLQKSKRDGFYAVIAMLALTAITYLPFGTNYIAGLIVLYWMLAAKNSKELVIAAFSFILCFIITFFIDFIITRAVIIFPVAQIFSVFIIIIGTIALVTTVFLMKKGVLFNPFSYHGTISDLPNGYFIVYDNATNKPIVNFNIEGRPNYFSVNFGNGTIVIDPTLRTLQAKDIGSIKIKVLHHNATIFENYK